MGGPFLGSADAPSIPSSMLKKAGFLQGRSKSHLLRGSKNPMALPPLAVFRSLFTGLSGPMEPKGSNAWRIPRFARLAKARRMKEAARHRNPKSHVLGRKRVCHCATKP